VILGKFRYEPPESFKDSVDRFKILLSKVRAVDSKQLPSEVTLMATLKEAFVSFENLWSTLEFTEKITLEQMLNVISRWRIGGVAKMSDKSNPIANFMLK